MHLRDIRRPLEAQLQASNFRQKKKFTQLPGCYFMFHKNVIFEALLQCFTSDPCRKWLWCCFWLTNLCICCVVILSVQN